MTTIATSAVEAWQWICDVVLALFLRAAYVLILTSLVLSFFHYLGWIKRALWLWIEHDVSKNVLNGTPLTLGSLEYDLLRGNAYATNVVIHQPGRDEWKWSSPLLGRAGRVYVEFNLLGIIRSMLLLHELPGQSQTSGLDLYSIEVSDVQVFIERRSHVFNFYLCDASLELPDPKEILKHEQQEQQQEREDAEEDDENDHDSDDDSITKAQAQEIVQDMFSAVNSLSRAAQRGSLKNALDKQRRRITTKLKELKDHKKKVHALAEGSRVIMHVGQTVVKTTNEIPPAPKRRESMEEIPPLYVRVGRIRLKEMRIFTQDNWELEKKSSQDIWNKPIVIDEVTIRSAELCPPMSLMDSTASSENPLPSIYQPIDRLLDVVLKRILAETAKTNTGRLFKTAMGEVLSLMKSSSSGTKASKRPSVALPDVDSTNVSSSDKE